MEDNKPIDGAEYISLEDAKRLKLPYFEGLAAGYPSPAGDYQHESLDLNEKFVHHPEASYFVRVRGESMIGLGLFDGDICLADRSEEITDGNIVVAFVNGGLTVKQIDLSTRDKGYLRLMPANPEFTDFVVLASGVVEIAFGLGIIFLVSKWRAIAGALLALFYVAIFPGNINQYVNHIDAFGLNTDNLRLIRLFFQPVLIFLALWTTGGWKYWKLWAKGKFKE